jgi:hypothetical protein
MAAYAKEPKSVLANLRESRHFLVDMADHENATDPYTFLRYLGGFLAAFRTVAFRLYGVTENNLGPAARQKLYGEFRNHPIIGFLLERANVELHEDGAVVYRSFRVRVANPHRNEILSSNEWCDKGLILRHVGGWQFKESAMPIIPLCHDGIEAMEGFVREILNCIAVGGAA